MSKGGSKIAPEDAMNDDTENGAKKKETEKDIRCICPGLQSWAKMPVFSWVLCLYALSYGMLNTYYSSMITTVEKTYGFSSSQSGWILSSYEIGFMCAILFVSYFGYRSHRPVWLGITGLLIGGCSILLAVPHFVFPRGWIYDPEALLANGSYYLQTTCNTTDRVGTPVCPGGGGDTGPANMGVFGLKLTAFILAGFGPTTLWTLGITYIDDNSDPPRKAPMYVGFMLCARQLAPILGYILGFIFLEIYVDLDDTDLPSTDPNFIGCWWLGYIVVGVMTIATAIPLMLFPRRLQKKHEDLEKKEEDEEEEIPSKVKSIKSMALESVSNSAAELKKKLENIPKVKAYIPHAAHNQGRRNTGLPDMDFLGKTRFQTSAHRPSMHGQSSGQLKPKPLHRGPVHRRKSKIRKMSTIGGKSAMDSTSIDSYEEEHQDLEPRDLKGLFITLWRLLRNPVYMCSAVADGFTTAALYGYITYLPKYMELQFGVDSGDAAIYTAVCAALISSGCIALGGYLASKLDWPLRQQVARGNFLLLIGTLLPLILMSLSCPHPFVRGLTYYSPVTETDLNLACNLNCHCSMSLYNPVCGGDGVTYFNPCYAGCEDGDIVNGFSNCTCVYPEATAVKGTCGMAECDTLITYLILLAVTAGLLSLPMVTYAMLVMRCVDECDKSVAFGFDSLLASAGAFAVSVIFGSAIDGTCAILRPTGSCGADQTACLIYDMDTFRYTFHVLMSCLILVAPVLRFIASYKAGDMILEDDEEEEDYSYESSYIEDIENQQHDIADTPMQPPPSTIVHPPAVSKEPPAIVRMPKGKLENAAAVMAGESPILEDQEEEV